MRRELEIWRHAHRLGLLAVQQGIWSLKYDRDWIEYDEHFALSPHLPLAEKTIVDGHGGKPVQWFFENLLPEGNIRDWMASFARISPNDTFGLLAAYGQESAGALTLLARGSPQEEGHYEDLSRKTLRELIRRRPQVPLIVANGRAHMSLAGAQHKLGIHRHGQNLLLPVAAASSWIIKSENLRSEEFPFCPANEHFCMNLAKRVGIRVPDCELWHLPEPVYLVRRFDRLADTEPVIRLHQIDLCQLLNKWPGYKYESEGGASFIETYRALDLTREPALSRQQILRWFIFNYLTGNSDAHAKNISFLVGTNAIRLAPAYDLLCVRVYGNAYDYLAMSIADEVRYRSVESRHWNSLAEELGLKPVMLETMRRKLAKELPRAAREQIAHEAYTDDERNFLKNVVATIDLLCAG